MKKVLFVLSSHPERGETGVPTGFHLAEASHPWKVLHEAGFEVDFVSPKGGVAPIDAFDLNDEVNKEFWGNDKYQLKTKKTMEPSEVDASDYEAIHFVGGHGTMWDFPGNQGLESIARKIYEDGGVVSAVCHGPAALVDLKLSDGSYLVDGKKVNSFTDAEEKEIKLEDVVPFLLESKLRERGAKFENAGLWQEHVVVDERLVTGQNPASAKKVGEEVLKLIR